MKQSNEKQGRLPEFLNEKYLDPGALLQVSPEVAEMLNDYKQLQRAIEHWSGQSEERVKEFSGMLDTLQREIIEAIEETESHTPSSKNQKSQGRVDL